jgi:hypothetical protein
MDPHLLEAARRAKGFMPDDEGIALYEAATTACERGPLLEIGSYCAKSTIYLGAAGIDTGTTVFSIDHHRGSEEHQPGQGYFDAELVDALSGEIDTLPIFRRTIAAAGLERCVVGIVGRSETVASSWALPLGMVFIDGGHSAAAAHRDYEGWAPHVMESGLLAIHDVFEDPEQGGRPPFDIYRRALESNSFEEIQRCGSLRVLQRVGNDV